MKTLFYISLLFVISQSLIGVAQNTVTRIYTDHNGFFMSENSTPSYVVSTQHLLAFQTQGTIWATGVNNAVLQSNNVNFVPLNFHAMPATVANPSSGVLIGMGQNFGGVSGCTPAVTLPFGSTNLSAYLTDGLNGLDLSTGLFNSGGSILYTVSTIDPSSIGDGVPDLLVTQTGSLGTASEYFRFLDSGGNIVGNSVAITFSNVPLVARPTWKFYTTAGVCGTVASGARDLRMLTFDFADLGLTPANYLNAVQFHHQLVPQTDVAFVGFNTISATILPITLAHFDAVENGGRVEVNWTTATEINMDYFTVMRSQDGLTWDHIGEMDANGNSTSQHNYTFVDERPLLGVSYYRLTQVDIDGTITYSTIRAVNRSLSGFNLFPNPTNEFVSISSEESFDKILIRNAVGQNVSCEYNFLNQEKTIAQLNVKGLPSGIYFITVDNHTQTLIVN